MDVYQLKIALRGISPMVWRRLKVAGNTDLADLHTIFQLAMGSKDYHLHVYRIYAKDYGTYKPGGMLFADDPKKVLLSDFHYRTGDRFEYAYDFTAGWVHDIRIEAVESKDTEAFDPVCTGGGQSPLFATEPGRAILAQRKAVYEEARRRHPQRWSGEVRNWELVDEVWLNPGSTSPQANELRDQAA